jgi:hypothetical protein
MEPVAMPATEPVIRTREGSATVDWAESNGVNLGACVSIHRSLTDSGGAWKKRVKGGHTSES